MRYLPQTKKNRDEMMKAVGVSHVDELFRDVPKAAFYKDEDNILPKHKGELEVERIFGAFANEKLRRFPSLRRISIYCPARNCNR